MQIGDLSYDDLQQYNLAASYSKAGNYDDALLILKKLHAKNLKCNSLLLSISEVYVNKYDFDAALAFVKMYSGVGQANTQSSYILGVIYGSKGKYDDAIQFLNLVLKTNYTDDEYYSLAAIEKGCLLIRKHQLGCDINDAYYFCKNLKDNGYLNNNMAVCTEYILPFLKYAESNR